MEAQKEIGNRKDRLKALKAMNTLIIDMNNENAYNLWIWVVPDQATEWDFEDIANDEEYFNEAVSSFKMIWKRYIEDGLYIGNKVY